MSSFAPSLRDQTADAKSARRARLGDDVLARRMMQRKQYLMVQMGSYLLTALIISIPAFEGDIPLFMPVAFALCGVLVTGGFLALSQIRFNDRFNDHYLTLWQMAANTAVQIGFIVAVPQINYVFFCIIFLIFSSGALRMTARQATIAWTLMTLSMIPFFLMSDIPINMATVTFLERLTGLLVITATVGQCVFLGLYGSGLRKQLYQSSQALRIAYDRIEELAEIDELTGAFNRRSIMRKLDDEISRARRLSHPCSVALIDLDWFKRINDTFGHPAGDEVLRTFAISAFANIRTIDAFGRYGGEEFLLLLPETPHDDAQRMLNRLRIIITELDWSALAPGLPLSISAGVATLQPNETPESFLARADAALYTAKRSGRNRVASAA